MAFTAPKKKTGARRRLPSMVTSTPVLTGSHRPSAERPNDSSVLPPVSFDGEPSRAEKGDHYTDYDHYLMSELIKLNAARARKDVETRVAGDAMTAAVRLSTVQAKVVQKRERNAELARTLQTFKLTKDCGGQNDRVWDPSSIKDLASGLKRAQDHLEVDGVEARGKSEDIAKALEKWTGLEQRVDGNQGKFADDCKHIVHCTNCVEETYKACSRVAKSIKKLEVNKASLEASDWKP